MEIEINVNVTHPRVAPGQLSRTSRRSRAAWVVSILVAALVVPFAGASAAAAATTTLPIGNLPGWKQIMAEDFTTSVALGSFPTSSYARRFFAYTGGTDTFGHGRYDAKRVNSVSGGALDWYLHKENGQPYVSALAPVVPTTGWGQRYGRYSVRYKSDVVPGYKMAFLLWPDTDNWGEGEIDFPEAGSLENGGEGSAIYANMYPRGNVNSGIPGASTGFRTKTQSADGLWHIATMEWSPGKITFILDGVTLGTKTAGVPNTSMHWVFQVETSIGGPSRTSNAAGHLKVDWAAMYSYSP